MPAPAGRVDRVGQVRRGPDPPAGAWACGLGCGLWFVGEPGRVCRPPGVAAPVDREEGFSGGDWSREWVEGGRLEGEPRQGGPDGKARTGRS